MLVKGMKNCRESKGNVGQRDKEKQEEQGWLWRRDEETYRNWLINDAG